MDSGLSVATNAGAALNIAPYTCPHCGAPLPSEQTGQPKSLCAYCGTTSRLGGVTPVVVSGGGPAAGVDPGRLERLKELVAAKDGQEPLLEALEHVARDTLGPYGETRAARNVVEGLARGFDAEHGTRLVEDPMVLGRLLEVYLVACRDIAANGATTLELPFITATAAGPLHFERHVSAADLAALASGAAPPSEKKRGFFARLFGN